MSPEPDSTRQHKLLADIIAVVESTKHRDFYCAVVERIPESDIHTVLATIQTASPHVIGHPGAYFHNAMVAFAHARGIELPELVNRDCYVPLCQGERALPMGAPLFCIPHWHELQIFQPEPAYDDAGIVAYEYDSREPWLRTLSYEDWRVHVFIREKELDAVVPDPLFEKYFPSEEQ